LFCAGSDIPLLATVFTPTVKSIGGAFMLKKQIQ
jgi:hypothetical protein